MNSYRNIAVGFTMSACNNARTAQQILMKCMLGVPTKIVNILILVKIR
jgi:hypothetical protein